MESTRHNQKSLRVWPRRSAKRFFDVILAIFVLYALAPMMLCVALLIRLSSRGPVIYWSDRIGKDNVLFSMPKFRTMKVGTPAVATHLLQDHERWVTPIGKLLRKLSLDELPQLYSVVKGEMSFVGPRPALFNQNDLVSLRTTNGIQKLMPGITGWAQINGRDEIPIPTKVELDRYYLENQSLRLDLKVLLLTVMRVLQQQGICH